MYSVEDFHRFFQWTFITLAKYHRMDVNGKVKFSNSSFIVKCNDILAINVNKLLDPLYPKTFFMKLRCVCKSVKILH